MTGPGISARQTLLMFLASVSTELADRCKLQLPILQRLVAGQIAHLVSQILLLLTCHVMVNLGEHWRGGGGVAMYTDTVKASSYCTDTTPYATATDATPTVLASHHRQITRTVMAEALSNCSSSGPQWIPVICRSSGNIKPRNNHDRRLETGTPSRVQKPDGSCRRGPMAGLRLQPTVLSCQISTP